MQAPVASPPQLRKDGIPPMSSGQSPEPKSSMSKAFHRNKSWLSRALLGVLAGAVLLQWVVSLTTFLWPWAQRIPPQLGLSTQERALRIAAWIESDDEEMILFLNERVPEDGFILLPSQGDYWPYTQVDNMGFYVFPRRPIGCGAGEIESCIQSLDRSRVYVIALPGYPRWPEGAATHGLFPFDSRRGVWVPR